MARLFKPKYPKMRTVKGSDGKTVMVEKVAVRGKNVGKKIMAVLREPILGRDGKPKIVESKKFYIEYRTADDLVRRVPGYTDKKATEQLASRLEREAAQKREGIIDRYSEHRKTPLSRHLNDYEQYLCNSNASPKHIKTVIPRVRKLLAGCRATYWSELSPSSVQAFIALLRTEGLSIQTCNFYLKAAKAFCQWCVKDRRFPENPIAHVQGGNVQTDRRHDRRSLKTDELVMLLDNTRTAPIQSGMTGGERVMAYQLALESGLRANEIKSLIPASFDLDGDSPTVTVRAAYSKHRREDVQPLRRAFCRELRGYLAGRAADAPAFNLPEKTAKMLRSDLAAARSRWITEAPTKRAREDRKRSEFLSYRDSAGRVADFHCLRHTFISNLTQGGVHPKTAQELARHSDISLTMNRYTHVARGKLASALEALPDLRHGPTAEAAKRTGTYDGPEEKHIVCLPKPGTSEGLRLAAHGTRDGNTNTSQGDAKSLGVAPDRSPLAPVDTERHTTHRPGLEPGTFGSVDRCSIQLSQRCKQNKNYE